MAFWTIAAWLVIRSLPVNISGFTLPLIGSKKNNIPEIFLLYKV